MVKEEFTNIKNLVKVRLKSATSGYIVFVLVFTGLLLIPLINNVIEIAGNSTSPYYHVSDMSEFILFGLIIGFIVSLIIYRSTNEKLSVYPQTNNSRLISKLLIQYITVVLVVAIVLAMYLVNLGVYKLMSAFSHDIVFALNIDFRFIIAGFLVYLAYSFLIVSVIELIGAVLRKWTYYAAVALTTLFALLVVYFVRIIEHLPRVFAFLIAEPSLLLFFLKAAGLWLAITVVTLVINRCTVYYKSHNQILKKGAIITCIIIAAAIITIVPAVLFEVSYSSSDDWDEGTWVIDENLYIVFEDITVDVSHITNGRRIDVTGTNIQIMEQGEWIWSRDKNSAIVSGVDSLDSIQGDTIVVGYRPAWYLINGIEVLQYTNQQLSVHLEGNTLILDYTRDNVHVILMPIWNLARQFDYFKDMGVLGANVLGISSGGNNFANIWIGVE
jgi:hypothetical protein